MGASLVEVPLADMARTVFARIVGWCYEFRILVDPGAVEVEPRGSVVYGVSASDGIKIEMPPLGLIDANVAALRIDVRLKAEMHDRSESREAWHVQVPRSQGFPVSWTGDLAGSMPFAEGLDTSAVQPAQLIPH